MSAQNRTSGQNEITAFAAPLSLATLKTALTNIWDSLTPNRDVTNTLSGTSIAANFSDYDSIIVNASGNVTITVSNIAVGESKTLTVNKTAGQTITFSGATDQSVDTTYVTSLTKVVYEIYSKESGVVIANPKVKTGQIVTLTDGAWNEAVLGTSWQLSGIGRQGMFYRVNKIGQLEIDISVYFPNATYNPILTTLPEGFRPTFERQIICFFGNEGGSTSLGRIDIGTNGQVYVSNYSNLTSSYLIHSFVIPLT